MNSKYVVIEEQDKIPLNWLQVDCQLKQERQVKAPTESFMLPTQETAD